MTTSLDPVLAQWNQLTSGSPPFGRLLAFDSSTGIVVTTLERAAAEDSIIALTAERVEIVSYFCRGATDQMLIQANRIGLISSGVLQEDSRFLKVFALFHARFTGALAATEREARQRLHYTRQFSITISHDIVTVYFISFEGDVLFGALNSSRQESAETVLSTLRQRVWRFRIQSIVLQHAARMAPFNQIDSVEREIERFFQKISQLPPRNLVDKLSHQWECFIKSERTLAQLTNYLTICKSACPDHSLNTRELDRWIERSSDIFTKLRCQLYELQASTPVQQAYKTAHSSEARKHIIRDLGVLRNSIEPGKTGHEYLCRIGHSETRIIKQLQASQKYIHLMSGTELIGRCIFWIESWRLTTQHPWYGLSTIPHLPSSQHYCFGLDSNHCLYLHSGDSRREVWLQTKQPTVRLRDEVSDRSFPSISAMLADLRLSKPVSPQTKSMAQKQLSAWAGANDPDNIAPDQAVLVKETDDKYWLFQGKSQQKIACITTTDALTVQVSSLDGSKQAANRLLRVALDQWSNGTTLKLLPPPATNIDELFQRHLLPNMIDTGKQIIKVSRRPHRCLTQSWYVDVDNGPIGAIFHSRVAQYSVKGQKIRRWMSGGIKKIDDLGQTSAPLIVKGLKEAPNFKINLNVRAILAQDPLLALGHFVECASGPKWLEPYYGVDLFTMLHKSLDEFTYIQRVKCLREIAMAYAYIHSKGCIHGDPKPENVVCESADGPFRLIDFDFTKLIPVNCKIDRPQGTPGFASPEIIAIIEGVPITSRTAAQASEVWGVGMLFLSVYHQMDPQSLLPNKMGSSTLRYTHMENRGFPTASEASHDALLALIRKMCNPQQPEKRPVMATVVLELNKLLSTMQETSFGRHAPIPIADRSHELKI